LIGQIWDIIAMQPLINSLIVLSHYLFNSFGLAIITLTIMVNVAMYPLTMKQLKASKAMQLLQPQLSELQKKYGKDKQKLAEEQMRLYKESGMSPAGCLVPMLVQMPVWLALFWSVMRLVAVIPENLLGLSKYLYSWPVVYSTLPLQNEFLWLNLAEGDLILAILVGVTMWLQQKMVTPASTDPKQQAQSRLMLWMMPMMFAFLTLTFPSGLALYWVTSNVIRIILQYLLTGWGALAPAGATGPSARDKKLRRRIMSVEGRKEEAPVEADIVGPASTSEKVSGYGKSGDERPDSSGGYPTRLEQLKQLPRRDRGYRHKRR